MPVGLTSVSSGDMALPNSAGVTAIEVSDEVESCIDCPAVTGNRTTLPVSLLSFPIVSASRIEKCPPAALGGELNDPAGWPFIIVGKLIERFELATVGCRREAEALGAPVGEEIRPMLAIDPFRTLPSRRPSRTRVVCV
jgi:hypothetical protein